MLIFTFAAYPSKGLEPFEGFGKIAYLRNSNENHNRQ